MSEVIEIVAYNPDWPRMFEDENGSEWSSFRLGTGVLLSRVAFLSIASAKKAPRGATRIAAPLPKDPWPAN